MIDDGLSPPFTFLRALVPFATLLMPLLRYDIDAVSEAAEFTAA